jgi:hypothetical protein
MNKKESLAREISSLLTWRASNKVVADFLAHERRMGLPTVPHRDTWPINILSKAYGQLCVAIVMEKNRDRDG